MDLTTGAVAVIGAVLTALIALFGVLIGQLYSRISRLESAVHKAESYNHRMWAWARAMLDLYYRWRKDNAPDPEPLPSEDESEPSRSPR